MRIFFDLKEIKVFDLSLLFDRYYSLLKAAELEYSEKFSVILSLLEKSSFLTFSSKEKVSLELNKFFQLRFSYIESFFLRKFFFVSFFLSRNSFFFPSFNILYFFVCFCFSNFIWYLNFFFRSFSFFLDFFVYFLVLFFYRLELCLIYLFYLSDFFLLLFRSLFSYTFSFSFVRGVLSSFLSFLLNYVLFYFFLLFCLFYFVFSSFFLGFFVISVCFFIVFFKFIIFFFRVFLSFFVFLLLFCYEFFFFIFKYFLNYPLFYYLFIYVYSFFLTSRFLSKALSFASSRNFGFFQVLSISYLIRNNLKNQDTLHRRLPFLIQNNFLSDFEVSNFFSNFSSNKGFYQHSNFRSRFLLFSEYLKKLSPDIKTGYLAYKIDLFSKFVINGKPKNDEELEFMRALRKKYGILCKRKLKPIISKEIPPVYRKKFVPLKIIKVPDKVIREFKYHSFLRVRSFPDLKSFRFSPETLISSVFYDKLFDFESSFYPQSKSGSALTSDLFNYFYLSDSSLMKDFIFFRKVFSRKNLQFFFSGLDLSSNFRIKFSKISPIFRYFYLKRERLKFVFSHNLVGDISPFTYVIALNWFNYYRVLRSILFDVFSFFGNSKVVFRLNFPRFGSFYFFVYLNIIMLFFFY